MTDALFDMEGADVDQLRAAKAAYEALGADARRTIRRQRLLDAGIHPTTKRALLRALPEGEQIVRLLAGVSLDATCGDCRFCETVAIPSGRRFVKCAAVAQTHGPGSDTRKKWPACTRFER